MSNIIENKDIFLTEYEKSKIERRQKIIARYNEYRSKYPDIKPMRLMERMAKEFQLTKLGVYYILIEEGVYIPKKYRKNERNTGVESRDNGTESRDNGSEDGNFRAEEFANCEL